VSGLRYAAPVAGDLATLGSRTVAGIALPEGALITPEDGGAPVGWIAGRTSKDRGKLWARLAANYAQTGLWPVILDSFKVEPDRPWDAGELEPGLSTSPDSFEAAAVLEESWTGLTGDYAGEPELLEEIEPFGTVFPGLAPGSSSPRSTTGAERVIDEVDGRIGLVSVARPADAIVAVGWMGAANYSNDMAPLAAVLRTWEERFDAFVVGIGFDTLILWVGLPPATEADALVISAEHHAFCPDNVQQGSGSIRAYAEEIRGRNWWAFWWD
jgi:hypothetical protein